MTQANVEQACAHETISGGLRPGTTLQAYANLEKQINTSLKKKHSATIQKPRPFSMYLFPHPHSGPKPQLPQL